MRPALYHRDFHAVADKTGTSATSSSIPARIPACDGVATLDLARQIAKARRDASLNPEKAAMLLRSWMSGDE